MIKNSLHIVLLFCVFAFANAQDNYALEKENKQVSTYELLKKDDTINAEIYHHSFEKGFQNKYNTNEFDYSKTKPRVSLWKRLMQKVTDFIKSLFPHSMPIKDVNKFTEMVLYTFYAILLCVVLYVLIKVLSVKEGNWLFSKKNKIINPKVNPLEENIHEIDFFAMISQYEQAGNYRMAVRYQFLYALKVLSDGGKINWHIEKTNSDYLKEFTSFEDKKQFEDIVYIFDYVWYGEFPIDKPKYENLMPKFQTIKNLRDE